MIELAGISKRYPGKDVLKNVSLRLDEGITCLMGASGAGKTTLLRILLGLETADAGQVLHVPPRVAAVFQEDRLVESLTVRKNLQLTLGGEYSEARANACLVELGLDNVLDSAAGTLSGGMKRRVALSRALLHDAQLLVMDEPFKGLDEAMKWRVMDAVKRHADGKTVLLVTHAAEEGAYLAARTVRLEEINRLI